jgi:hypothetical protein
MLESATSVDGLGGGLVRVVKTGLRDRPSRRMPTPAAMIGRRALKSAFEMALDAPEFARVDGPARYAYRDDSMSPCPGQRVKRDVEAPITPPRDSGQHEDRQLSMQ